MVQWSAEHATRVRNKDSLRSRATGQNLRRTAVLDTCACPYGVELTKGMSAGIG